MSMTPHSQAPYPIRSWLNVRDTGQAGRHREICQQPAGDKRRHAQFLKARNSSAGARNGVNNGTQISTIETLQHANGQCQHFFV